MDSNPELWQRNDAPKSFFNPLSRDISVAFYDDDNRPHTILIPSLQLVTYPAYRADFLIKHLVDAVVNERKLGFISPEERLEIQREIEDTGVTP